ncbi:BsuBI/PstI family type II restriction endonuclease [Brevundimonas sp. KM4]|uniref:BsuBI/PstI family type II restriction endonuclease n=1 Tax=Brevundimonas sp. KM4 TaxID=1628191 RepID=UPI0035100508
MEHVAYVTAFLDRSRAPFKKAVDGLAWGSYAWFAAEPERLVAFSSGKLALL